MKIRYTITGLDCPNCAAKLANMIEGKEGISSAKINFLTEKLTVETELNEREAYGIVESTAKAFSRDIKVEK
ncbi:MAG: cation transporter [Clostridia bacterium]|nr:cation transporter [Clostridia bacterium]